MFNADQIDGLPEKYLPKVIEANTNNEPIVEAEAFFDNLGMTVRHGGSQAFYNPGNDFVQMPNMADFESSAAYYGTKAHEAIHWTKHESRLDRDLGKKKWGDEGYAMEELVAELGAAFTMAGLGLSCEPRPDHASYIDHWLKVMKGDKRAIFSAASLASAAVDYLNKKQPKAETAPDADNDDDMMEMAAGVI